MPTATETKDERTTWTDWLPTDTPDPPIDDLITRSVLLDQLHARGVDISERELRYFEAEGAIPRPIRRWRGGVQAFYPTWFLTLVPAARALRRHGLPFDEIAVTLRRHFDERTGVFSPPNVARLSEMAIHTSAHGVDIDDTDALTAWSSREEAISDAWQEMADKVESTLVRLAEQHRQAAGVPPGSIEIILRNQDGRALATYKRYLGDDESPSSTR